MFDFDRPIFENAQGRIMLCAHRGVSCANIPCNTMAAFRAAIMAEADMIELDVARSKEGELFVFHPGMEKPHLHRNKELCNTPAKKIEKMKFVNQDDCPTFLGINRFEDVLDYLKGKCYINVDKYWTDIPGISAAIRRCGVEKQVIVKAKIEDKYIDQIKEVAPDFMFMPIVRHVDNVTDDLVKRGINCIGAEVLFEDEKEPVASREYIESMHKKGRLVFANAIVYDSTDVIAAGRSDDNSIIISPDYGWGWLADRGFDIIQTDWCGAVKKYLDSRSK